jgi:HEAT repeat protein
MRNLPILLALAGTAIISFDLSAQTKPKSETSVDSIREVGGKSLNQWIKEAQDPDPGIRALALKAIARFGISGRKASHVLVSKLSDRDPSIRTNAAIALAATGIEAEDARTGMLALAHLLSDHEQVVRYWAALTLASYGALAREAVPYLISAARDPNASWEVRKAVVAAIGCTSMNQQESPHTRIVQALRDSLRDPCGEIRAESLKALILLGKPASQDLGGVLLAIKKAFNDRDPTVVIWAHAATVRLDRVSPDHIKAITKYLKAADAESRSQAAMALAALGKEAAGSSLDDLTEALADKEPQVLVAVIQAVRAMGESAQAAVPELQKLRGHTDEAVRKAADEAIAALAAKPAK